MDYDGTKKRAADLIRRFGQPVTIRRTVMTEPENPWETPTATEQDLSGVGVAEPYSERLVNGTSILAGDFKLTMASQGVVPVIGDRVVVGDVEYGVVNVLSTSPGGIAVVYTLQLRR